MIDKIMREYGFESREEFYKVTALALAATPLFYAATVCLLAL